MARRATESQMNIASAALSLWRDDAPSNRFLQHVPGEVAARFLLPICVNAWGYQQDKFYEAEAVEKARAETGGTGFENYTARGAK